jgi:hypothetical protein
MDDDLSMDTSQDVFYLTEGTMAYAGYYLHAEDNPLHTHSLVEIAFAVGGAGTHHCVAGRRELRIGEYQPAANSYGVNCRRRARTHGSATCCGRARTPRSAAAYWHSGRLRRRSTSVWPTSARSPRCATARGARRSARPAG